MEENIREKNTTLCFYMCLYISLSAYVSWHVCPFMCCIFSCCTVMAISSASQQEEPQGLLQYNQKTHGSCHTSESLSQLFLSLGITSCRYRFYRLVSISVLSPHSVMPTYSKICTYIPYYHCLWQDRQIHYPVVQVLCKEKYIGLVYLIKWPFYLCRMFRITSITRGSSLWRMCSCCTQTASATMGLTAASPKQPKEW